MDGMEFAEKYEDLDQKFNGNRKAEGTRLKKEQGFGFKRGQM